MCIYKQRWIWDIFRYERLHGWWQIKKKWDSISFGKKKCPFFLKDWGNEGRKWVELQRNYEMDRKKAEGVCFQCFHLHNVRFQITCQEQVGQGQWGGRRRETKKMEVFRSLKMVWGTCVLFIIMHHSVMISQLLCSTSKVDTKIRFAFMFEACKRKNILFGKKDSLP